MNPPTKEEALEAILTLSDCTSELIQHVRPRLLQELTKHKPCKFFVHAEQGQGKTTLRLFIKPAEVTEEVPVPRVRLVDFSRCGYTLVAEGEAVVKFL